jgi:asparagine synthase (glutamine-hydrolysing)
MCGIAGIYSYDGNVSEGSVRSMVSELHHRGPDDEGYFFSDQRFKAGMRRLSIVDLIKGTQPFENKLNGITVFYNGEIYNYERLRVELESDGIHFHTTCDGEVISHLYAKYGIECFHKFDGMFSMAIWDSKSQALILSRDYPGEKPLYYSLINNGKGLAFSSEIKSLMSSRVV